MLTFKLALSAAYSTGPGTALTFCLVITCMVKQASILPTRACPAAASCPGGILDNDYTLLVSRTWLQIGQVGSSLSMMACRRKLEPCSLTAQNTGCRGSSG
jgi:hypothetical protein